MNEAQVITSQWSGFHDKMSWISIVIAPNLNVLISAQLIPTNNHNEPKNDK